MKKIILNISSSLASLALMVTTLNVNSTCMLFIHQPELPDGAKKLRRF